MTIEALRRTYHAVETPDDLARMAVERFFAANLGRTAAGRYRPAWAAAAVFAVAAVFIAAQQDHDAPRVPSISSLSHLQSPASLQGDLRLPTLGTLRIADVSAGRPLLAAAARQAGGSRAIPRLRAQPLTPTIPEEKER